MAGSNLVQALTRGLIIMETLAKAKNGQTVQQLADELSVSPPAVHNLLRTLADRGYVARLTGPIRYVLGSAVNDLASTFDLQAHRSRMERALFRLRELHAAPQWVYAEQVNGEVVSVLTLEAGDASIQTDRGSPLSSWFSASALAYQAWCSPSELTTFRETHPFAEYGAGAWPDVATVDTLLQEARAQGYIAPRPAAGGYRVALPVMLANGRLAGTLGGFWKQSLNHHSTAVSDMVHAIRDTLEESNR